MCHPVDQEVGANCCEILCNMDTLTELLPKGAHMSPSRPGSGGGGLIAAKLFRTCLFVQKLYACIC